MTLDTAQSIDTAIETFTTRRKALQSEQSALVDQLYQRWESAVSNYLAEFGQPDQDNDDDAYWGIEDYYVDLIESVNAGYSDEADSIRCLRHKDKMEDPKTRATLLETITDTIVTVRANPRTTHTTGPKCFEQITNIIGQHLQSELSEQQAQAAHWKFKDQSTYQYYAAKTHLLQDLLQVFGPKQPG